MEHEMIGYKDGDWIKFLCPKCDKQRWINTKTNEIRSFGGNFFVNHSGNMGPLNVKDTKVSQQDNVDTKPEAKAWLNDQNEV